MKSFISKLLPSMYTKASEIKSSIKYLYLSKLDQNLYKEYTQKQYRKRTGKELDFNKLRTYTEKMQYAKLYKNSKLKTLLTDKYEVREWVREKIGEEYLIPIYGSWDKFSDIDWDLLPNKFVLKANHGAGWNVIIKDKYKVDCRLLEKKFDKWMNTNFAFVNGIELHYKDIQPKIIAEQFLTDDHGTLNDYKFLCFNGEVYYCWIDIDRFNSHKRNVYDMNWELQPWTQHHYENSHERIPKPKNFKKMIDLAKLLSEGFSHVRVDLYNVDGCIYFGEMTFTNGSGFEMIYPEYYNRKLGDLWDINKEDVTNSLK